MLIVQKTADLETALSSLMKTLRLKERPEKIQQAYRAFWLGKAYYHAEDRKHNPIDGTVVFLADARVSSWTVLGVYQHQDIDNVLDMRDFHVNFWVEEQEPEPDAEIMEPIITENQLNTKSRLLSARRLLARTMKLGKVEFSDDVEYHLIYRPYWDIEFKVRKGTDTALISQDDVLVRKR